MLWLLSRDVWLSVIHIWIATHLVMLQLGFVSAPLSHDILLYATSQAKWCRQVWMSVIEWTHFEATYVLKGNRRLFSMLFSLGKTFSFSLHLLSLSAPLSSPTEKKCSVIRSLGILSWKEAWECWVSTCDSHNPVRCQKGLKSWILCVYKYYWLCFECNRSKCYFSEVHGKVLMLSFELRSLL